MLIFYLNMEKDWEIKRENDQIVADDLNLIDSAVIMMIKNERIVWNELTSFANSHIWIQHARR